MKTYTKSYPTNAQPCLHGTRRRLGVVATLLATVLTLVLAADARAQSDDFTDGDDVSWTRYSPLTPFGVPGVFTFPDGGYRIQTTVPTGMEANPGRAGSIRTDVTYTDFYVAVDVVNWKDDTRQAFGVLGRINDLGLGTTKGYAFTYERGSGVTPTSGDLDISRLDNEAPDAIDTGSSGIHLDPDKDYRFVFIGKGASLEGRVYELPNTTTPLITIAATDSTYTSGYSGLVVYDNSGGNGVSDATFDNFLALPEEPPRLSIERLVDIDFVQVFLSWPASFSGYRLESTPVLPATTWTDESVFPGEGIYYHLEPADAAKRFFRLVKP